MILDSEMFDRSDLPLSPHSSCFTLAHFEKIIRLSPYYTYLFPYYCSQKKYLSIKEDWITDLISSPSTGFAKNKKLTTHLLLNHGMQF